jgi:hypothetical protein
MYILQEHAKEVSTEYPRVSEVILKSTYMDDVIDSFETVEEAHQVRDDLQSAIKPAGFLIIRWCSNSIAVPEGDPEEDRAKGIKISEATLPSLKTLGVWWDAEADVFTYFGSKIGAVDISTKRQLLSQITTVFDPFQFL